MNFSCCIDSCRVVSNINSNILFLHDRSSSGFVLNKWSYLDEKVQYKLILNSGSFFFFLEKCVYKSNRLYYQILIMGICNWVSGKGQNFAKMQPFCLFKEFFDQIKILKEKFPACTSNERPWYLFSNERCLEIRQYKTYKNKHNIINQKWCLMCFTIE